MDIEELMAESHRTSREHGFWDGPENANVPTKLALIHSEVSEALEEFRSNKKDFYWTYKDTARTVGVQMVAPAHDQPYYVLPGGTRVPADHEGMLKAGFEAKPEGLGIELADAMIRICDLAGYRGIDLNHLLRLKMDYNKTRLMMHGGKRV